MQDYHFALSGRLQAGTNTTLALRNSGAEMHMAGLGLLKTGKNLADVQAALASEDSAAFDSVLDHRVDTPGGILSPGQSQQVTAGGLTAGTYAIVCFLPAAGDGTPHFAKGMIATFDVAPGPAAAPTAVPKADADYTISDGHITGPTTLRAGAAALRVTSAGVGPHEFFVMRKRRPATTYADVDAFFTNLFESDTPPPKGYADGAPAIIVASSFDVASGQSVLVRSTLAPGDYLIGCARKPDASEGGAAKEHSGEILDVTVT
jgi:uncharacterized cupredoxin-like copper-binding protein